jgi:hypothetical protein
MAQPSNKSTLIRIAAIGGAVLLIGGVAFLAYEIAKKKKATDSQPTSSMALSGEKARSNMPRLADRTPDLATEAGGNQLYDVNGTATTGPQPVEIDYESSFSARQPAPDEQWAGINVMSSNDALSMANPDNAQWFSQNLLPNAELSCGNDGMITDGPTFEELSIFTPRLLEAAQASRFFQEPPQLRGRNGSDIRPVPIPSASAGSRDNLTWGISSIQQSDIALDNAGRMRAFCVS